MNQKAAANRLICESGTSKVWVFLLCEGLKRSIDCHQFCVINQALPMAPENVCSPTEASVLNNKR